MEVVREREKIEAGKDEFPAKSVPWEVRGWVGSLKCDFFTAAPGRMHLGSCAN